MAEQIPGGLGALVPPPAPATTSGILGNADAYANAAMPPPGTPIAAPSPGAAPAAPAAPTAAPAGAAGGTSALQQATGIPGGEFPTSTYYGGFSANVTPGAQQNPVFYDGAANVILNNMMDGPDAKNSIASLQYDLYNAGYMPNLYVQGQPSPDTRKGLSLYLNDRYNGTTRPPGPAESWRQMLSTDAAVGGHALEFNAETGRNVAKGARSQVMLEYTNPTDVQTVAQGTAYQMLGRSLTPAEMTKFQNAWASQEAAYQKARFGAIASGGQIDLGTGTIMGADGSLYKEPTIEDFAKQYAASTDPVAMRGMQARVILQHLNNILSGGPEVVREPGTGSGVEGMMG